MKTIIATFDHNYYLWQCLVQINNFMKYGYDEDTVYIIATSNPSHVLTSLMNCEKIKAKFYLYKDTRTDCKYPVTLRHHILEKFYLEHPEYEKETILLTDPDVIFTKKIDLSKFEKDDKWYFSDTRSYISSKYIKNYSEKLFDEMCEIVGVSPKEISDNDDNAGGAQYIMKGVNAEFWKKCNIDSEKLYNYMNDTKNIYNKNGEIQSWTADMWAIFWNGIYFGHKINIHKDLDFCWAVHNIKRWNETYLFHNAGISGNSETHFSKIVYQDSPFNKEIKCNNNNCTYMYLNEVKDTEKNFKEIIW